MRLVLYFGDAEVEFTEESAGGAFPYLIGVSNLRMTARAGYISGLGVTERPSVTATLNNAANKVAGIVGHPIRLLAAAYDDADNLLLRGPISGATFGRNVSLTVEA